jgi:cytochrome c oxidase subunit 2
MSSLYDKYIGIKFMSSTDQVERLHDIYGFPEPANESMLTIIDMYHNTVITLSYILIAIVAVVVGVIEKYQASVNPYPVYFKKWQESLIDVIVVLVPIIVVWYLTVPTVGYLLHQDTLVQAIDYSFTIEVVGHQWYWTYYLDCIQNDFVFDFFNLVDGGNLVTYLKPGTSTNTVETNMANAISFDFEFDQIMDIDAKKDHKYLSVNKVLVLPVNEYIRVVITSEDVIHSWALPQLGIKVDAIPGRMQIFLCYSNKFGVFYGQCSELCGVNHGFMPICVEFVSGSGFLDWYLKNLEVRPYRAFMYLTENLDDAS